jgi:hypothetical protein
MAGRLARAYLCFQSPFRGSELDNDALGSMAAEAGVSERPFVIPFLKCLVMLEKLGAFSLQGEEPSIAAGPLRLAASLAACGAKAIVRKSAASVGHDISKLAF